MPEFAIVIDTREQAPLSFSMNGLKTEVACLDSGDYAVKINGVLSPIRIERKEDDVWGSFHGDNLRREIEKIKRAKEAGCKYIIAIGKSCQEIRRGSRFSKRDPLSLIRTLLTIARKYDITVWWCHSREEMAFLIQECLYTEVRNFNAVQSKNIGSKELCVEGGESVLPQET